MLRGNWSAVQAVNKLPNAGAQASDAPSWEIKMLYDGDCPLCMREVNMLKRRDAGNDRIAFVDIASPSYSPQDNAGISFEEVCSALGGPRPAHVIGRVQHSQWSKAPLVQAMGSIHGILPDGKVITNVEVFRRLYEAVGLGWIYAITKIGPIKRLADVYVTEFAIERDTCKLTSCKCICVHTAVVQQGVAHVSCTGCTAYGQNTGCPSLVDQIWRPF